VPFTPVPNPGAFESAADYQLLQLTPEEKQLIEAELRSEESVWSTNENADLWLTGFDLIWSDPTSVDDDHGDLDESGFSLNNRGGNVVSFGSRCLRDC